MEDADKPLGAPKDQEQTETPQTPPKSKRKLNWKGFLFAIVAVVFIEWFAITSLNSEDPVLNPPTAPTGSPIPTATITTASELVSIVNRGGLCPAGNPCQSEKTVDSTGAIKQDGKEVKQLSMDQIQQLQKLINETDFNAIKEKPFKGTCPVTYDGQETMYTFQTPQGNEVLEGCKYDIDPQLPLFLFIEGTIQK